MILEQYKHGEIKAFPTSFPEDEIYTKNPSKTEPVRLGSGFKREKEKRNWSLLNSMAIRRTNGKHTNASLRDGNAATLKTNN